MAGGHGMSIAPDHVKQSMEKKTITFDFLGDGYGRPNCKLKTNDTIASVTSVLADGAGLVVANIQLSGQVVFADISAGNIGQSYQVRCIVLTLQSNILALVVPVDIQEKEN